MGVWDTVKKGVQKTAEYNPYTPAGAGKLFGTGVGLAKSGARSFLSGAGMAPAEEPKIGGQGPNINESMSDLMGTLSKYRQQGLDKGAERGRDLFGEGSLGRIKEGRSADMSALVDRLRSKSTGWSDPEAAARKEMALRGISSQLQTNLRAGRANTSAGGLRGAIASAQQKEALKAAQQSRSQAEQGLMVSGEEAAREGLKNYYSGLSGQEDAEQKRTMYNQEQVNKERMARIATELGYGQLAGSDMAAAGQIMGGQQQANLAQQIANQNQGGMFGWMSNLFNPYKK